MIMDEELKIKEFKNYEISFLSEDPSLADEILSILNKFQAEIILDKKPEKINLAYPIKHKNQAFFGFFDFRLLPEKILEIDKILRQNKNILRFMIIVDPAIKDDKQKEKNKNQTSVISKMKINSTQLTNQALEKKIEEILEEK